MASSYGIELDPTAVRFYTHVLPVPDQFSKAKCFPGGKAKTTLQKLHAARLPRFDPIIDRAPLLGLTVELAAPRAHISGAAIMNECAGGIAWLFCVRVICHQA